MNKNLFVVPVCHNDIALMIEQVKWFGKLDDFSKTPCLVVTTKIAGNMSDAKELVEECEAIFGETKHYTLFDQDERGGVQSSNFMFKRLSKYVLEYYKDFDSFYFYEYDVTAVKKGWWNALREEYKKGGKPFMGCLRETIRQLRGQDGNIIKDSKGDIVIEKVGTHINGSAFYPIDAVLRVPTLMMSEQVPWDIQTGADMVQMAYATNLMHVNRNNLKASELPPECVAFHGDKDHSLLRELQGGKVSECETKPIEPQKEIEDKLKTTCFNCKHEHEGIKDACPNCGHKYDQSEAFSVSVSETCSTAKGEVTEHECETGTICSTIKIEEKVTPTIKETVDFLRVTSNISPEFKEEVSSYLKEAELMNGDCEITEQKAVDFLKVICDGSPTDKRRVRYLLKDAGVIKEDIVKSKGGRPRRIKIEKDIPVSHEI